jgi:hypothetical protein
MNPPPVVLVVAPALLAAALLIGCCCGDPPPPNYERSEGGWCPKKTKLKVEYDKLPSSVKFKKIYKHGRWYLGPGRSPRSKETPSVEIALGNGPVKPGGNGEYHPGKKQAVILLGLKNKKGPITTGTYAHTDVGAPQKRFDISIEEPGKKGEGHVVSINNAKGGEVEITRIWDDRVCGKVDVQTEALTLQGEFDVKVVDQKRKKLRR